MLTPPALTDQQIIACLGEGYGLRVVRARFLPLGADLNSAAYRVDVADQPDRAGAAYFLKLRRGDFDPVAVEVPAWLHAQGIGQVMAPIASATGRFWVRAHGFDWMLYPFVEADNGFERALSPDQWIALGASLKAIHAAVLPAALAQRVPQETYSPHLRASVRAFDRQIERHAGDDQITARFAALWQAQRGQIQSIVDRAEQLGAALAPRPADYALCHSDLHGGNVLVGDELFIVDWDNPILAPKERDLMFVGNRIGRGWDEAAATWFYRGYGQAPVDRLALAYYRYERIVADIAAYAEQLLDTGGSLDDREVGLRQLAGQFEPGDVVEIADATYRSIAQS